MDTDQIGSDLEEELTEQPQGAVEVEIDVSVSSDSVQPRGRGRPRIPPQWQPVISLDHDDPPRSNPWDIATSLIMSQQERIVPSKRRERDWEPIWCPRKFAFMNKEMAFVDFALTDA